MLTRSANCRVMMLLVCLILVTFTSQAGVGVKIDYVNRYIWRGFDLNPDNHYVVQPSLDYAFPESRWSVNVWHSISAENSKSNEIDLTFNYNFSTCKDISMSAGIIHYGLYWVDNFNQDDNTSIETYFSASWDKVALKPKLSFYHDCKNRTVKIITGTSSMSSAGLRRFMVAPFGIITADKAVKKKQVSTKNQHINPEGKAGRLCMRYSS